MKSFILVLLAAASGAAISWFAQPYLPVSEGSGAMVEKPVEPLYWVAPMDPDFRRDQPGLSPMGMALVPVYEETEKSSPGVVNISAAVESQVGVTTARVQKLPWVHQQQAFAEVIINPQTQWQVQLRVDGWIEKAFVFSVGESIKAGQPLFDLYSPALVVAQEEFLVALADGEQGLIRSARERLRALNMPLRWINALQKRRKVQDKVRFVAQKSGVVTSWNLIEGKEVKAGSQILSIADLSRLWLKVHLTEELISATANNSSVQIFASLPATGDVQAESGDHSQADKRLYLDVESAVLYPILDQRRSQVWQFDLDNRRGLWQPGEYLTLTVTEQNGEVLQLPSQAIIDDGLQPRVVIALGDGRFKSVAVKVGRSTSLNTHGYHQRSEILAGLAEGDRVVTSAQFLLDSESSVNSDLLRFYPLAENKAEFIWLEGELRREKNGRVTVRHSGAHDWQWPAMQQNFHNALSASKLQKTVRFNQKNWSQRLKIRLAALDDGDFCVVDIMPITQADSADEEHHYDH